MDTLIFFVTLGISIWLNVKRAKAINSSVLVAVMFGVLLNLVGTLVYFLITRNKAMAYAGIESRFTPSNASPNTARPQDRGETSPKHRGATRDEMHATLLGTGYPTVQVVGESRYSNSFRKIFGEREGDKLMVASLHRERNNQYDKNAVRVDVMGLTVGYLPKETASDYHALLDFVSSRNVVAAATARLWFSGANGDSYGSVTLDITHPSFAYPVNPPPDGSDSVVWPQGSAYQVSNEGNHLAEISALASLGYSNGDAAAFVELIEYQVSDKKTLVGVTHDGKIMGTLSPQTSTKFLTIIAKARQSGKRLFALANIQSNSLAAEIVVLALAPERLSSADLESLGL